MAMESLVANTAPGRGRSSSSRTAAAYPEPSLKSPGITQWSSGSIPASASAARYPRVRSAESKLPSAPVMIATRRCPSPIRCRTIDRAPSKLAKPIESIRSPWAALLSRTTGSDDGSPARAAPASSPGDMTMRPSTRPRMERSAASNVSNSSCALETSRW